MWVGEGGIEPLSKFVLEENYNKIVSWISFESPVFLNIILREEKAWSSHKKTRMITSIKAKLLQKDGRTNGH